MPIFGPVEIIVVLAIVLLIFGPKRLPGAGKALGQSMREFKESISGSHSSDAELPAGQDAPAPAKSAEPAAVADANGSDASVKPEQSAGESGSGNARSEAGG